MKKLITIIGIVLTMSISNISTAAYDGRGDGSCSELRKVIKEANNKLKRFRKYSRGVELHGEEYRQAKKDGWNNISSLSIAKRSCNKPGPSYVHHQDLWCQYVDEMLGQLGEAKDEVESAREDYSLNGCTSGGKTNYQHNYSN